MIILVVVILILAVLTVLGLRLVHYAFGRKPTPDFSDPQAVAQSHWAKYAKLINGSMEWLNTQDTRPLQVMSYDGKMLRALFVTCEQARGTILLFHGYGSGYAVDFAPTMAYYNDLGFQLLLVDQRAQGTSEGRYITFGVRERIDVLSWVTYLSLMLGEDHPLFLGGLSMGASTVLMAADQEFPGNVRGIIADCGFTCPRDILRYHAKNSFHVPPVLATAFLGFFTRLFAGFGLRQADTREALSRTKLPVLLFHGTEDQMVPVSMSRENRDACAGPVTLVEIPGANHAVSFVKDPDTCHKAVEAFLRENLPQEAQSHD